ncbi:AMP-binding protein [Mycobacterium stomatepiae]|nr:AMP-binding protein [Mycobacterium stomatepiae]
MDDAGHEVPPGAAGELTVRGKMLMSGYFDEPALTATALRDGWLHTGDIARLGSDGNYRICGRKKNIVIRGGYNIHPEEITEVLQMHPSVTEAVSFGRLDPIWGETLVALVVARDVAVSELHEYCAMHLEPRKLPTRIVIVPKLPRGRSGKVLLDQASTMVAAAEVSHSASAGGSTGAIEDRLLDVAARCFKQPRAALRLTSSPEDISGWDSLAHMEFVVAIEAEFGIELSARDIMGLTRLDKALPLVQR